LSSSQYQNHAIYLMIISAVAFTIMNAFVKYLDHIGSYQLIFFRGIVSLVLCIPYLVSRGIPLWGNKRKWLILRGIVGTISLTLFFLAIKHIPLGSAVTLRYLSPIFAAILALLFLGERVKKIQWMFFIMAFVGAALLKGFDFRITALGFGLILGSAFFSGMVYAIIKKIGTSEHPFVIVLYFMAVATVLGLTLSIPSWLWPSGSDLSMLISIGVCGFFGQIFMTMAIQKDTIVRVIPFKYAESLLAIFVGLIWFGESFGLMAIVGIFLIIAGMILNVVYSKSSERMS